ncbi:MAG: N-acetylmuramoyl-L-alanine amidase [Candidatus Limnocylindrus sp.]
MTVQFEQAVTSLTAGAGSRLVINLRSPMPVYAVGRGESAVIAHTTASLSIQAALGIQNSALIEYTSGGVKTLFLQETNSVVPVGTPTTGPIEQSGGVRRGTGYDITIVAVNLAKRTFTNPFTSMNWTSYVQGVLPPSISTTAYPTNTAQPYGPAWGVTRPPGTPKELRFASTLINVTDPVVPADMLVGTTLIRCAFRATSGLRYGIAHPRFDNRPLEVTGGPGIIDPGPFGDQRGGGIVSPYRAPAKARIDRYGVFQWTAGEWADFSTGYTVPYYDKSNYQVKSLELAPAKNISISNACDVPLDAERDAVKAVALLGVYMQVSNIEPAFQEILLRLFIASYTAFKAAALFTLPPAADRNAALSNMIAVNKAIYTATVGRGVRLEAEGLKIDTLLTSNHAYIHSDWQDASTQPAVAPLYGAAVSPPPAGNLLVKGPEQSSWVPAELGGYAFVNAWGGAHVFPPAQIGSRRGVPPGLIVLHWGGESREQILRNLGRAKSTHFTVASDGSVHQHAYLSDATWHANLQNDWAIGIDLCTPGLIPRGKEADARYRDFTPVSAPLLGSNKYALAPVAMYESTHLLIEQLRQLYPDITDRTLGLVHDVSDGKDYVVAVGGYYLGQEHTGVWYGVTPHMMLDLDKNDAPSRADEIFMFIYHCLRRRGVASGVAYQRAQETIAQTVLRATPTLPPRIKLLVP